jgi:hypothetical protein
MMRTPRTEQVPTGLGDFAGSEPANAGGARGQSRQISTQMSSSHGWSYWQRSQATGEPRIKAKKIFNPGVEKDRNSAVVPTILGGKRRFLVSGRLIFSHPAWMPRCHDPS